MLFGMALAITVNMEETKALIQRVFRLTREMISLSDEGLALSEDDGCRVLFGVLQDCAYKIRQQAERAGGEIRADCLRHFLISMRKIYSP